jgi:Glycosyl hydrolase 108
VGVTGAVVVRVNTQRAISQLSRPTGDDRAGQGAFPIRNNRRLINKPSSAPDPRETDRSFLAKEATGLPHSIDMRNAAVASGVNHMVAGLPDALARQGVTQDTVARMVNGELGKLEATDPAVSIGPVAATAGVSAPFQTAPTTDQTFAKPAASTTIGLRGTGAGGVGGNLPPAPPAAAAMSPAFTAWCAFLIPTEGVLSLDRTDPGNWTSGKPGVGKLVGTKYDVAASSHPDLDIANLTLDAAQQIAKAEYWDKVNGDALPGSVAFLVADAAWGSGPITAAKQFQAMLGVGQDDVIGTQETIPALMRAIAKPSAYAMASGLDDVLTEFCARRLLFGKRCSAAL